MKTLIAIPCTDTLEVAFDSCKDKLIMHELKRGRDLEVKSLPNCLVYNARHMLAQYAINEKFDYVLWLDSDMTFEEDLLEKMFESLGDNHYLTALCFGRRPPFNPCIYKKLDVIQEVYGPHPTSDVYLDYPRNKVFEIGGSGYACVLQSVEMLDVMLGVYGNAFFPSEGFGEDLTFCYKAKQIGYSMYCDSSIKCGHLTRMMVDESFVDKLKLEQSVQADLE